jgi:hypothetical protein
MKRNFEPVCCRKEPCVVPIKAFLGSLMERKYTAITVPARFPTMEVNPPIIPDVIPNALL